MQIESLLQIKQIHGQGITVLSQNNWRKSSKYQSLYWRISSYRRDKQYEESEGLLNKAKEIINFYHNFPKSMSY